MQECGIDDDGAIVLAEALACDETLDSLGLYKNDEMSGLELWSTV